MILMLKIFDIIADANNNFEVLVYFESGSLDHIV